MMAPVRSGRITPAVIVSSRHTRKARQMLGWRQGELAAAAGVSKNTLSRLETGFSVRLSIRAMVAAALAAEGIVFGCDGSVSLPGRRPKAAVSPKPVVAREAEPVMPTGRQVQDGRRLLGWKQDALAAAASISEGTLCRIETGYSVRLGSLAKVIAALEDAGIAFTADGSAASLDVARLTCR